MWEIADNLYLGDRDDARDRAGLRRRGVTHVLNCAEEVPCHFAAGDDALRYRHLRLHDPDERFGRFIAEACAFIDAGRRTGGVLVHCSAGVSRSAAAVLAWLCCSGGHALPDAARRLRSRVLTNPDPVFLRQIAAHLGERPAAGELARLSDVLLGRADE